MIFTEWGLVQTVLRPFPSLLFMLPDPCFELGQHGEAGIAAEFGYGERAAAVAPFEAVLRTSVCCCKAN